MHPDLFLADLEAKPRALKALAAGLERGNPWRGGFRRVLFLGMGSSRYAAGVAARRLRALGVDAHAEYASAARPLPPADDLLVVAISATGGSRETLDVLAHYDDVVALTNNPGSAIAGAAREVVLMEAGEERGGVACRTFQHTLVQLMALEERLTGGGRDLPALVRKAAEAASDLLERRDEWLPKTCELLDGPHGVYTIAPAERLSSAQQSALMFREGPRRPADACESGDWSHVDVYLTKTLDYRAILFPGSAYDEQAMEWVRQRGSTVLTVGRDLRYRHDDDPDVALLTETLVAELVAATWWNQ
ncbi:SIS domain-containing protein [Nonomuraea soli]|uniref:Glutamine--fructose-6-phosphate aminotransferase [isomerizing] n=1 Tax=Nonomuraea soli TaxID=1032476 RepID=A0A7W0CL93_9ACTN|nr:SIS domain-containing protein [Nonomuraea soli]MBA2893248.1 fructoselysine-6-P-deglycase FrlB-like protein [Nonomuraea soli]